MTGPRKVPQDEPIDCCARRNPAVKPTGAVRGRQGLFLEEAACVSRAEAEGGIPAAHAIKLQAVNDSSYQNHTGYRHSER